jgi:hypothetical protein
VEYDVEKEAFRIYKIVKLRYNYLLCFVTKMTSEHDIAILNCVFNPLLPLGEAVYEDELPHNLQGSPLAH